MLADAAMIRDVLQLANLDRKLEDEGMVGTLNRGVGRARRGWKYPNTRICARPTTGHAPIAKAGVSPRLWRSAEYRALYFGTELVPFRLVECGSAIYGDDRTTPE